MSFFLGSWGMNRSAEQTNRPRTASRFTRFVCPVLRFIPHEPRKKDTHSLNIANLFINITTSVTNITNSFSNIYNGIIFPSLNPAKIFQFNSR